MMNTKKQILAGFLVMTIVLSSCSIQKRIYTAGYHVEWKHTQVKSKPNETHTSAYREPVFHTEEKIREIVLSPTSEQDQNKNVPSNKGSSMIALPTNKSHFLFSWANKENKLGHQTPGKQLVPVHKKETGSQERGPVRFMLRVILLVVLVIVLIALIVLLL